MFSRRQRRDGADVQLGRRSTAQNVVDLYGQDLAGKIAVVTGANSGIGYETCRVLAKQGCRVVMVARSEKRGTEALERLKAETSGDLALVLMDLADLDSIEEASKQILTEKRLDYVILNAGIMACPLAYTKQGFESQIGSNHFGHFHFVKNLLEKIKADALDAPNRVVALASKAHTFGSVDTNDLHYKNGRRYSPWSAYGQSKTANILFARELADRLKGTQTTVLSVHPGVIATNLWREGWFNQILAHFVSDKNVPQGAATTVYACLAPQLEQFSGSYLDDCDIGRCDREATDESGELRKKLWEVTEEQIQETRK